MKDSSNLSRDLFLRSLKEQLKAINNIKILTYEYYHSRIFFKTYFSILIAEKFFT